MHATSLHLHAAWRHPRGVALQPSGGPSSQRWCQLAPVQRSDLSAGWALCVTPVVLLSGRLKPHKSSLGFCNVHNRLPFFGSKRPAGQKS